MTVVHLTQAYARMGIAPPKLHLVIGSGIGLGFDQLKLSQDFEERGQLRLGDLPGLEGTTAPGHPGLLRYYFHRPSGHAFCVQIGRLHGFEGLEPRQVVAPLVAIKLAGTENFILTNAAGGLNPRFKVGTVMLIKDHVNLTGKNPLVGPNPSVEGKALGPRFPDMTFTYDEALQKRIRAHCQAQGLSVDVGTYIGLLGPSYETPAEIKLFAQWGMDAVGMSTVWEVIALKHAGARLAALSFICNIAAGLLPGVTLDHEEVEREGRAVAPKLLGALFATAGTFLQEEA